MRLCDALDVRRGEVVSFVGGGGKTSAMVRLGHELTTRGWRVLATTTTRIGEKELALFPHTVRWQDKLLHHERKLDYLLDKYRFVLVYQSVADGKVIGVPDLRIIEMLDGMNADAMLVEADGSRRLPLKAPRAHEPAMPADTTLVVPVAGLDALGQPLDERTVYNPDPIIKRYGFPYEGTIQPAWIAQILRDKQFGLKDVPASARVVALLNKVQTQGLVQARARRIAQMMLRESSIDAVALAEVQQENNPVIEVHRRIAAIVLAGGLSRRMGRSKPLLPWGNRTVIENIVGKLIPFRLSDVVVVTGYKADGVNSALGRLPVRTVFNPAYAVGEMLSSLKAGLRALGDDIDACLVVMGDQPQLSPRIVRQVINAYNQGAGSIVAPSYRGQRGHPVLIQRRYWPELLELSFGSAPRDVVRQYPVAEIACEDDSILRDIDTPEQYAFEKRLAGLE
jgi:molybdenum cofactor cytidylyltransferase